MSVTLPAASMREALWRVHPRVHGDHRVGAADPADHDRHAGPEVGPAAEPVPAEDVDRDEDRLEEEEDPLDREQDPEHVAEAPGERRPQQAELEREHRPGDRPDGEGHGGDLRPAPGELERDRVIALEADVVGDQHQRREGDAEAGEDDVEAERERHLAPRRQQLGGGGEGGEDRGHGADRGHVSLIRDARIRSRSSATGSPGCRIGILRPAVDEPRPEAWSLARR